jgi:hypothetical protein
MHGFLGAFRQTQWLNFRRFILNERRAVDARVALIDAELGRIGEVKIGYIQRERTIANNDGSVEEVTVTTERRSGFHVTEGSSLHKLCQAYIAQGGSPLDISMFLQPDAVEFVNDVDPDQDPDDNPGAVFNDEEVPGVVNSQPHFGIVAHKGDSPGIGGGDKSGWPTWGRFSWARIGRTADTAEASRDHAIKMDWGRRWAHQSIAAMNHVESKIIKLMDLREQLIHERDKLLQQSVGGSVDSIPLPDENRYHTSLHVTAIVQFFDSIFYNGSFDSPNFDNLSQFDTLWRDRPDDDPYHT